MKIEIKKAEKPKFDKIEIKEPTVQDYINAERIAGNERGFWFSVCLISQIVTFDGKKLPPEDIAEFPVDVFTRIIGKLQGAGFLQVQEELQEQS